MPKTFVNTEKLAQLLSFDAQEQALVPEAFLVGIDEVGRGCLAGPVVAAAVYFKQPLPDEAFARLKSLNDSKQLSALTREALSQTLHQVAVVGIGSVLHDEIDALNIHRASLLAGLRAFYTLFQKLSATQQQQPVQILIDGRAIIPELPPECQKAVIKGDGQSACIAAASVVAKHYRDTWMSELAVEYPHYGWAQNKGYPTPEHVAALNHYGLSPYHRQRFKTVQQVLQQPNSLQLEML